MKRRTAAITVAAVLSADALLHVYWATGRTWPAPDAAQLSQLVLNADVPFTPPVVLPLATALLGAATAVLAQGGVVRVPVPPVLPRWGTRAVAAGMLVRGLAGLVWATGVGVDLHSRFYLLNLALYTPLCLGGAALAWRVGGKGMETFG